MNRALIFGAEYKHITGETVIVYGAFSTAIVVHKNDGKYVQIPKDVFFNEYTLTGKHDHENFCCDIHGTHVSPHQGCILR